MSKKKMEILAEDKVFHVKLKRQHPNGRMKLGAVVITIPGNYKLLAGTVLGTQEVETWFEISPAKKDIPTVKPAKSSEVKE
jgi:hypothetical protein